jgi:hypothetical protein
MVILHSRLHSVPFLEPVFSLQALNASVIIVAFPSQICYTILIISSSSKSLS